MQGRLTDFFLFSQDFSGSPLLGYHQTSEWEKRDPRLDLGTAMAISGAAAAPQMGTGTITRAQLLAGAAQRSSWLLGAPAGRPSGHCLALRASGIC